MSTLDTKIPFVSAQKVAQILGTELPEVTSQIDLAELARLAHKCLMNPEERKSAPDIIVKLTQAKAHLEQVRKGMGDIWQEKLLELFILGYDARSPESIERKKVRNRTLSTIMVDAPTVKNVLRELAAYRVVAEVLAESGIAEDNGIELDELVLLAITHMPNDKEQKIQMMRAARSALNGHGEQFETALLMKLI